MVMLVGVEDVTSRSVGASETGKDKNIVNIQQEKKRRGETRNQERNSLVACVPVRG